MDWQFRVAHYGLFLSFGIVFPFHSTIFDDVINFVVVLVLIAIVVLQTLKFVDLILSYLDFSLLDLCVILWEELHEK